MDIITYENLNKITNENGQVLVEIEPNVWIDYESNKPIEKTEEIKTPTTLEVVNNGE